jgi:hypothetical protein
MLTLHLKNEDAFSDVVNSNPNPFGASLIDYEVAFMIGEGLTDERVWVFEAILDAMFKQRVRVCTVNCSKPARLLGISLLFTDRAWAGPKPIPL